MQLNLELNFHSHWHAGTGQSAGAYSDALVLKDKYGLPFLSGKSLKGVLRDAFFEAQRARWLLLPVDADDYCEQVFGMEGGSVQGCIRVSNAQLSNTEQAILRHETDLKKSLFTTIHSTTIDHATGTAKDGSLRSIEVAIPMQLHATIYLAEFASETGFSDEQYEHVKHYFVTNLERAFAFIWSLGANKYKGLGEVSLHVAQGADVA